MLEIGKINELKVVKEVDFGVYFDGGEYGEILMPKRYVPNNCKLDDLVNVFVYRDSEDRLIATTEMPKAMVGEFALLEATSVTTVGAFLDWGLPKDLLVPYREQRQKWKKGKNMLFTSISTMSLNEL
jgi:predicted RNA-binding protein (virulence factor B family)